jgi:hypothetical protein
MRIPHINWKSVLEVFEKVVVGIKLFEGVKSMFGFFKNLKADIAEMKAKLVELEEKIEAFFVAEDTATKSAPVVETAPAPAENPDAK